MPIMARPPSSTMPYPVQQNRRYAPSTRQPEQCSELPQAQSNSRRVRWSLAESQTRTLFSRAACWLAVHQAGKHRGHANKGRDAEALNKVQRAIDVEVIQEAAANARH